MYISQSRRFIFIHIVKAAGESVTELFDESGRWNDLPIGGTQFGEAVNRHYQKRHGFYKHSTSQEVRSVVGEQVWNDYFTFTFVRHPYSRILSLYKYAARMVDSQRSPYLKRLPRKGRRKHPMWQWEAIQAYVQTNSFSEFIRHPQYHADEASLPQTHWIQDEHGQEIIDFVGRVENLEADLRIVADRVGLPAFKLTQKNRSAPGSGPEHFPTEEDYRLLEEAHQADFERFDYDPKMRIPIG